MCVCRYICIFVVTYVCISIYPNCLHHKSGWHLFIFIFIFCSSSSSVACKYFHLNTIPFAQISRDLFFVWFCFVFVHLFTASLLKIAAAATAAVAVVVETTMQQDCCSCSCSPCGSTHVTDWRSFCQLEGFFVFSHTARSKNVNLH